MAVLGAGLAAGFAATLVAAGFATAALVAREATGFAAGFVAFADAVRGAAFEADFEGLLATAFVAALLATFAAGFPAAFAAGLAAVLLAFATGLVPSVAARPARGSTAFFGARPPTTAEGGSLAASAALCVSVPPTSPSRWVPAPVRSVRWLSVEYQPLPLNTIEGAPNCRVAGAPHFSHACCDGEPNGSCFS